jgi:hypothetical protein
MLGPNITGFSMWNQVSGNATQRGAIKVTEDKVAFVTANSLDRPLASLEFNASWSNSIYDKSNTVQPSSLVFNYIIKY